MNTRDITCYIRIDGRLVIANTIQAMEAQLDGADCIFIKLRGIIHIIPSAEWPDKRGEWIAAEQAAITEEQENRQFMTAW